MEILLLKQLQILKKKYAQNGFLIIGIFGSQARGDSTPQSDIDILYDIDASFLKNYSGWKAIEQLENIKQEIQTKLHGLKVDLSSCDNNSRTFQKYIKDELVYV